MKLRLITLNGKRAVFDVEKATCLLSDRWTAGRESTRWTTLWLTKSGRYVEEYTTLWQGESSSICEIEKGQALQIMTDALPEHLTKQGMELLDKLVPPEEI